ncbi:MAG: PorP/SprF family type IX secretion system membrane protein [Hymenobacter sp.]
MVVYYDQAGVTKMTNAALSYSQHIKLGQGLLGIGVQGIYTYIGKGTYRAVDPDDVNIPANSSDHKFDGGAGIWYEAPKFYAGLSMNNLFQSEYTFKSNGTIGTASQYLGENHAYLTAGYNIEASSNVTVTPMVLVKAVLPGRYGTKSKYDNQHNYSFDAGVRATLNNQFSAGLNFRYDESVSGLVGY